MSELEELKAAVDELRDIEALKSLKARYCHLVDAGRWDELAELWTEDATCDYGFFGCYHGRDEIVNKFFRELAPYFARRAAPEHARPLYGDTYLYHHFFVVTSGEAQQMMQPRGGSGGTSREE